MKHRLILTFKWIITIILLTSTSISLVITFSFIVLEGLIKFILWFPIWLFFGINIFTINWFSVKLEDYIIILDEKLHSYIWKNKTME